MDASGADRVVPCLREEDTGMQTLPWIADFPAGYMQRVMHLFPKQGTGPWRNTQDFSLDKKTLRKEPLLNSALIFSASSDDVAEAEVAVPAQSAG